MQYDYSKLEGKIVEKYGTRKDFAEAMETSERTLSLKLNNRVPWKQNEMHKASKLLDFPESDIQVYFFTYKVQ